MAVSLDQVSTAVTNSGVAVTTATHTNLTISSGLSNSALIFWAFTDTTATGLTLHWDSAGTNQLMTNLGSQSSGTSGIAYLFGLRNPTAGNKTLTATWGTAGECALFGASFSGVNQTSDAAAFAHFNSATGTSTTPAVTITSATGDIALCGVVDPQTWSSSTQTNVFNDPSGNLFSCAGDRAAGAASVVFSETWNISAQWAAIGIDIVAAASDTLAAQIWI